MLRILLSACLIANVLGASIPLDAPQLNGYIVGGNDTDISKVPYQIAMYVAGSFWCGGSIVSPNFIVTAGHCVNKKTDSSITFRVGSSSNKDGGVIVSTKKVYRHPMFNLSTVDYDVAVVELSTPIQFNNNTKPIKLATKEPKHGTNVLVSGWGRTSEGGGTPKTLQSVNVPMVERKICADTYKPYKININQRMICAGIEGKDSCQGDSGGPLAYNGELVGIVSFGVGCGRKDIPGVYVNVADAEITKFIKDIIKA